ncbi:MAG: glycosyltransferase family protein [Herminiimonas sp.]|nr:glycosyltransferase family protein [Herminiimonas sp.]
MHMIFYWLLLLWLTLLAIPVLVLTAQVALACVPGKKQQAPPRSHLLKRPTVAILVPAHNEESGISCTVASLRSQLWRKDRILVIADNCTDGTAQQALESGAEVCIRQNPLLRGKSYALEHGIITLAANPPQVVIVIDADCQALSGSIDTLVRECSATGRPVQSLDLMQVPNRERPAQRLAEFAWLLKNQVRPAGFARAGLPCQLMGTGMAFPWSVLTEVSLASGHLAEDVKLGLDLASAGYPPRFCATACVVSSFPKSEGGARVQRTRWEHGQLALLWSEFPRCFFRALFERNCQLFAMALDLLVPPMALMALACAAAIVMTGLYATMTGVFLPMVFAATLNIAFLFAILLAWWKAGRDLVSAADFLYAFGYALNKVPLYLRFFVRRESRWIRTERD